jgi:hypothetical protein
MKGKSLIVALAFMTLLFLQGCGGESKTVKVDNEDYVEVKDPFAELTELANQIIEDGGVAAVGQGTSKRMDIAEEKARTDAQGNLAEIFNTKVQRLKRKFEEEIGSNDDTEINEAFSNVTKTLTSKTLKGAIVKKKKIIKNKKGQYITAVVLAVTPKTVDQSILDEMKNNKKVYERFRASQAYKDLDKEMKDYEASQQ